MAERTAQVEGTGVAARGWERAKAEATDELSLLDSLALSFGSYLFWMGSINVQGHTVNKRQTRDLRRSGGWAPR